MTTTERPDEFDDRVISTPLVVAGLLLAIFSTLMLVSCGDSGGDGGNGGKAGAAAVSGELETMLEGAGQDAEKLLAALRFADEKLAGDLGDDRTRVEILRGTAVNRFGDALKTLVKSYGDSNQVKSLKTLDSWITKVKAAEEAKEESAVLAMLEERQAHIAEYLLIHEPGNSALRSQLGYTAVEVDFAELREAPYLDTTDFDDLKKLEETIERYGDRVGGKYWLRAGWEGDELFQRVMTRIDQRKKDFEERMNDPWEKEAQDMFDVIVKDLEEALSSSYQFVARTYKPYVMIVEKDRSWNETEVAAQRAEALLQLYDTFYNEYGANLNLKPVQKPIPVIYFRRDGYQQYANKRGLVGAAGHFEPDNGRLFTSKGTDIGTVFHEGTHQLSFFNTPVGNFLEHSYWFEEGLAEFLAGNTREVDKETGGWKYEIGLLQLGRLNYWRQTEHKAYSLWDLLDLRYRDRQINIMNGDRDKNLMVYSQGWFLCYFMNHFRLDSEGVVVIGEEGKYRDKWMKFFAQSISAHNDRKTFLECMGMPDATPEDPRFIAFEKEFDAYFEWANSKVALEQVKNNKFIPWNEVMHRGKMIGEKVDDKLPMGE